MGVEEVSAIFSSFGNVLKCEFVGNEYSFTSAVGVTVTVKTAHIDFETHQSATDALAMNNSNLAGVLLHVELAPPLPPPVAASPRVQSNIHISSTVVKLQNMVKDIEEVFEEDFKEEIAEEVTTHLIYFFIRLKLTSPSFIHSFITDSMLERLLHME